MNGILYVKWHTSKNIEVPDVIQMRLVQLMEENNFAILNVHSEIIHNGLLYGAYPNYRGGGPWYDWCMVKYALDKSK
jgi:hypothetical protein